MRFYKYMLVKLTFVNVNVNWNPFQHTYSQNENVLYVDDVTRKWAELASNAENDVTGLIEHAQ